VDGAVLPGPKQTRSGAGRLALTLVKRYAVVILVIVALILLANYLDLVSQTPPAQSSAARLPAGITAASAPGTPGTTVGGGRCAPGVRQVPWSYYAPICVPAWHGNNGGATAPGVTGSTITITYREASSAELSALYSLVPAGVIGTNQEAVQTMQAYIKTFNREFELYGRHVVLKAFVGMGDFVQELNGQDQQDADEDALTAKALGAFADSSVFDSTPVYTQALADQHVIGLTIFGGPNQVFEQASPYLYTSGTVCSQGNAETEQLVRRVLDITPSSFAGDPSLNGKMRVFGMIVTGTAQTEHCEYQVISDLKSKYGITMMPPINLSLDGSNLIAKAGAAIGQLKAAGVTTVLCSSCDFFTPVFLTKAADAEDYHPEWIQTDFLDALTALQSPTQLSGTRGFGTQVPPQQTTEAYKAFELGASPGTQIVPSFSSFYAPLLMFFDALQAAGPDLTPRTFQQAFRRLPPSLPGGMYGNWAFSAGSFDPHASYGLVHWSSTELSAIDGQPGAWVNCNNGRQYNYSGLPPQLPIGDPVDCSASGAGSAAATAPPGNAAGSPVPP